MCTGFSWERQTGKVHLKDQIVDGVWGPNAPQGNWLGCVEWIQLAQDRDRWRAVVNAVMNHRFLAPRS
jgi:hypothetical protein